MRKMIEALNPRETVLVTSRAPMTILGKEVIKDNILTVNWHMPVSFKPPLFAVSIGKTRYSEKLIRKSRVFAVNFIPYSMKSAALYCGSYSGEHLDKFAKATLEKKECEQIDCPWIKGSVAHLECTLEQAIDAGDHIIFLGKVLQSRRHSHETRLISLQDNIFTEL